MAQQGPTVGIGYEITVRFATLGVQISAFFYFKLV